MSNELKPYIYNESSGLWYQICGDYYISCLVLENDKNCRIGKYGRLHRRYLAEHRPCLYNSLVLQGALSQVLANVDHSCRTRMDTMITAMQNQEGVTEELKATDQMEWIRRMNNIHNRAEEVVLRELVYA